MDWKKIGRVARLVAYVVVPGAAGYVAYRYVIRPWLDGRKARQEASETLPHDDKGAREERPVSRHKTAGS